MKCQRSAPSSPEWQQWRLVVASGRIEVNGEPMGPLDGAAITKAAAAEVSALEDSELVMVEIG